MFCTKCGTKVAKDALFCAHCGTKQEHTTSKVNPDDYERSLPDNERVSALLERAYDLRKQNSISEAIALCHEALAIHPNSASAHSLLGQMYEEQGIKDKAIQHYEMVVNQNPDSLVDREKLTALLSEKDGTTPPPKPTKPADKSAKSNEGVYWMLAAGLGAVVVAAMSYPFLTSKPTTNNTGPGIAMNRPGDLMSPTMPPGYRPPTSTGAGTNGSLVQGAPNANETTGNPAQPTNSATSGGTQTPANPTPNTGGSLPNMASNNPNLTVGNYPYGFPMVVYNVSQNPNPSATAKPTPTGLKPAPVTKPDPTDGSTTRINVTRPAGSNTSEDGSDLEGAQRIYLNVRDEGTTPTTPRNNNTATTPRTNEGKINVRPSPQEANASPLLPTPEARSLISVGQDKMRSTSYAEAINAFRKAVGGANDEAGYVFSQLGEAYRQLNDNKNAKICYEAGIKEYKKLISAGRQTDQAREGVRLCENGIKLCDGE